MSPSNNQQVRNEHLHAGIDSVTALRDELPGLDCAQVRDRLDVALAFYRHEVAPHARAEERVFYPTVSEVLGIDLFDRMVSDHRRISELVGTLTKLRHELTVNAAVPVQLRRALTALVDASNTHLRLEEEALRRVEAHLSESDSYFLHERMEQSEMQALRELSAPQSPTTA